MWFMVIAVVISFIAAVVIYMKNNKSKIKTLMEMKRLYELLEKKAASLSQKVLFLFYKMLEAPGGGCLTDDRDKKSRK